MKANTQKQVKALRLAIKVLTENRRRFAAGEAAYTQQGITDLTFAVSGHKNYVEHNNAIQELEDLIEIVTDPGVTIEPEFSQEQLL